MASIDQHRADYDALPPELRALLDAELAAGNEIAEVGPSFPAPPAGAYFKLAKKVTTRPRKAGKGLRFRDVNSSLYSGEFGDERKFYFILEPPGPPPPEPDMNAIRNSYTSSYQPPVSQDPITAVRDPQTSFERFKDSMAIDYEKWHDGIGYDLDAIASASPSERKEIETLLLARGAKDWRDVEALAALKTAKANEAIVAAASGGSEEVRMAALDRAPELFPDTERTTAIVNALDSAVLYGGLSATLQEARKHHPPEVVAALLRATLHREGEVAYHCAATLLHIHQKIASRHGIEGRPFLLRFNTTSQGERRTAFRDLCEKIELDPRPYLKPQQNP